MIDVDVVVVCLKEIEEVALREGYGKTYSPWDEIDFIECGAFDVDCAMLEDYLMFNPNDAWSRSCLKIMEEEKEDILFIVDSHKD